MLEPNESEISADVIEDACKSDYFSDEGEAKHDSSIVESSKRKPEDSGLDEAKKFKVSVEESSSKVNSVTQNDPQPTSGFIRAGSVTSDNSDEFVDASDVLVEPTQSEENNSKTPTDDVDSCAVKNTLTNDTFKSNIFEPEAPKVKDNKFIKRLPTFADDPLERFNSSAIRRGFIKESENIKPIDFNFDFSPSDKGESKGENKTIKKVKLNRSKFATAERPKFSDDSSSDSNSRFNVSSTSPVKSDLLSVENKERNFKSVNLIKPAAPEKISPLKETPSATVSSSVPVISSTPVPAPTVNASVPEVSVSTPTIIITPPAVSVAVTSVNIASLDNDSTPKVPAIIPPPSSQAPVVGTKVSAPALNANPEHEISSISTKDENPIPEVENIVPESSSDAFIDQDVTTDETNSSPQPVTREVVELSDEKIVETDEIFVSEIEDESVEEVSEIEPKIDKLKPQLDENLSQNVLEDSSENLQDSSPAEMTDDMIQTNTDLPQDIEMSLIENEVSQKPNDDVSEELKEVSQTTVSESELSDIQKISEVSEVEDESLENESEPILETNAAIIEPESSSVLEPTPVEESISVIEEPEKTASESDPESETFALNMEPESVINDEPEPSSEKSDKIDEIDLTSDIEDLTEEKTEHESSNEDSEGEIEEEEEEEEEIEEVIHEEEVYLDDRAPEVIKCRGKSPLPISTSQPRIENDEVMEIDDDEPVQVILEPSKTVKPREPLRPHRTPSIENIEDILMEIDESESASRTQKPKELSKLEQALIGKPVKKLEIQIPVTNDGLFNTTDESSAQRSENEENKEKIKLHLSLQGDRISIKKGPLDAPTGEVRVKRQYRKRRLENVEVDKSVDKTYKLRNRTIKKDEEADLAQTTVQNNGNVEVNTNKRPNEVCVEAKPPEKYSAEPVTIDLENIDSQPTAKVQPIKLKISKNSNITIECGDKSRTENCEEGRKKDTIPNYMEKAATAWSGPDLQRVERLLKESNITITPVMSKEAAPQTPQPAIKQLISVPKEKPAVISPSFSTPSVAATVSFQANTASITPIINNKYEDSSADETPSSPCDQTENGDTTIDLDSSAPSDDSDTPSSSVKQVDVKFEIRKKLASAEKRKQESKDSNDSESELSDSKPKSKVPDLLPINFPTPEMLQNFANSLNSSTSNGEAADGKKEIDPAFLPLLQTLPKKRGRPTKAMVAAREALKQSQEVALESLRQLATQKGADGEDIMAHFPIPLFDMTDSDSPFKAKRGRKPKSDRNDKSDGDQSAMEDPVLDPIREAEEIKRLEEERIRKEEERERKNEIRRQKAKERNDLVKAKRLRQKMKAEERQKRMQEKRRQLQEEKKKLEEEIKNLPSTLTGFDDETRMSAENSQLQSMSFSMGMGEDDSSNATTELSQRMKKSRMEVTDADSKDLTVDQIAEYQWPIQGGELYMIQEQVSNFLGVKSFKRKYPDIKRRPVDSEERAYLVDSGLVSETLCDLGLTAVCSAEVLDIMCADFPDKYEELRRHMREKQMKELSFKQKAWANGLGYKLLMADGTKQDLKKRAMESASNWNLALNKSRGEDRRCAMDLQTFIVHYPKNRTQKMTISTEKMGSYPVSILPGQFCDYYKPYTSTELRYMPVNTVLYGPLKPHTVNHAADGSQTDSDDSSSSDESSTTSEGTQATEDTIEDTDKDMSVDESSQLGKSNDLSLLKDQMTMELSENTRELIMDEAAKILCKVCLGNMARNKENVPEVLICCSQCSSTSHPTCLDLSPDMVPHIKKYAWQCPDCKICARCKENADEDKMLFCDTCDRGYHIYCVGLKKVPSGRWQCQECITNVEHTIFNSTVRETFKEPGLIEITDG